MLSSLFGNLGAPKDPDENPRGTSGEPDRRFAATAIMESVATEFNARGQMVDRHSKDLVVSGSPAQAIREHFANTRVDLDTATALITLLDPANAWASSVIKALSDAGGRPIERLHLREQSTLRTLATIERTTLARRDEDSLRVYHAEVRAPGSDNAEIPIALMERSQLTAVIIGPLPPHAIDALLDALHEAVRLPTWSCPTLLFMLPPSAAWIAHKISTEAWPARLDVQVISETMSGASSVWNAILAVWNQRQGRPIWPPGSTLLSSPSPDTLPLRTTERDAEASSPERRAGDASAPDTLALGDTAPMLIHRSVLDPRQAQEALATLRSLNGLLGCAVADVNTGLALACERGPDASIDMELAMAGAARLLRVHRQSARAMGLMGRIDEIMISAGPRQQIIRTVKRHPDLFLMVLFDRHRTRLGLARLKLMGAERLLP
ncbi:MAG: hypothetical protein ABIP61_16830 [Burkholderiaceae bacterium]